MLTPRTPGGDRTDNGRIEMDHLPRRMDTRIRSPGAHDRDRNTGDLPQHAASSASWTVFPPGCFCHPWKALPSYSIPRASRIWRTYTDNPYAAKTGTDQHGQHDHVIGCTELLYAHFKTLARQLTLTHRAKPASPADAAFPRSRAEPASDEPPRDPGSSQAS